MLETKAKKKLAGVFAFLVALLLGVYGTSSMSADAFAANGDGATDINAQNEGVEVISVVNTLGMPDELVTGTNEISTSQDAYAPKSKQVGDYTVVINPAARMLGGAAPSKDGIVVDVVTEKEKPAIDEHMLVYLGKNGSTANTYAAKVFKEGDESSTWTTVPTTDFVYNKSTGILSIASKYQDNHLTVYNYVTANQLPESAFIFARQTNASGAVTLKTVQTSISVGGTSYPQPASLTDNNSSATMYVAQETTKQSQNAFFKEMVRNGGKDAFLGQKVTDLKAYVATIDGNNKITGKWSLRLGQDFMVSARGEIKFLKDINAAYIVIESATAESDTPVTPELKSRTNESFTIIPVNGYIYQCVKVGTAPSADGWTTSTSFTGLEEGQTYEIYYAKDDGTTHPVENTITSRKFKTQNGGIVGYTSPFNVGDSYSCNVQVTGHGGSLGNTIFYVNMDRNSWTGSNDAGVDELKNSAPESGVFHCISPGKLYTDKYSSGFAAAGAAVRASCTGVNVDEGYATFYLSTNYFAGLSPKCQDFAGTFTVGLDKPMNIELYKESSDPQLSNGNDAYSVEGAEYGVWKNADCSGDPMFTLKTDAGGYDCLEELDAGTYYVKELNPPAGMEVSPEVYTVNGKAGDTVQVGKPSKTEPNKNVVVDETIVKLWEFHKLDNQSGFGVGQSDGQLSETIFEVQYFGAPNAAAAKDTPTKTWYLKSDANGTVNLDAEHLVANFEGKASDDLYELNSGLTSFWPLGHYKIKEVKAPTGYLLSDPATHEVTMSVTVAEQTQGTYVKEETAKENWKDQVYRGDFSFIKLKQENQERMAYIPFLITNKTSGEAHVVLTDENGVWEPSPIVDTTNKLDALYDTNNDGIFSAEEKAAMATADISEDTKNLCYSEGLYFTGYGPTNDPDGKMAAAVLAAGKDSLNGNKCMPYGEYIVEELPCKGNFGLQLVEQPVRLYRDQHSVPMLTINDGTVVIGTLATDQATGTHEGDSSQSEVTLIDEVQYKALTPGKKHTLTATLHVKGYDENHNVVDKGELKDGNGKSFTATAEFVPEAADGTYKMQFVVPSNLLYGKEVVVFEELYAEGVFRAEHKDIEDTGQTVSFPDLHTTATDKKTGTHEGAAVDETVTVIDEVAYDGLIPGKEYTVTGTLMDKATGNELRDAEGHKFVSSVTFKPENGTGSVYVEFEVPSSVIAGKTIVVFEDLINERGPVTTHADINDESQTVSYPGIHTNATDGITNVHEGNATGEVTINDEVTYENLIKGKEYTLRGVLMDQATGESLKDAAGNEIVSEVKFRAGIDDESQDALAALQGAMQELKTLVSNEDLTDEAIAAMLKIEPSVDEDADANETPAEPSKSDVAAAVDKFKSLVAGLEEPEAVMEAINAAIDNNDVASISEKIAPAVKDYNALYNMLNDETKAKVAKIVNVEELTNIIKTAIADNAAGENGGEIERVSGTVTVPFTFDGSIIKGKTTVVFEKLYDGAEVAEDKEVANHEDIEDGGQSVSYPDIHTLALVDGQHTAVAQPDTTIVDTVSYTNLIPGKTYIMQGILMDKATGESLKDVNGNEYVARQEFTVPVDEVEAGDPATGDQPTDPAANEETPATNEPAADAADNEAIDTNTESGDTAEKADEPIKVVVGKNGTVDVTFKFDASAFGDKDVVVFENLYRNEVADEVIHVATHEDINDTDQTVHLDRASDLNDDLILPLAETGDIVLYGLGASVVAAIALAGAYAYRRRKVS